MAAIDYTKCCFVIMPFGKKPVGKKEVDFDSIFKEVFYPAITATQLPEGGKLEARRTDQDFFASDISVEMFQYLEYSRFALADISGLNANVFYELGVRHRAHQVGTAIFRQTGALIPFDITSVKAFDYNYEPVEEVAKSRALITRILTESLRYNRLDSPVQVALAAQRAHATQPGDPHAIDEFLREAENAVRRGEWYKAIDKYREAIEVDPKNYRLRLKLGLLLKDRGLWESALVEFTVAAVLSPQYTDALREKGIAENKLYHKLKQPAGMPDGKEALLRAISLDPNDFDALASLGGILKREQRYQEALDRYHQATQVSHGHSYPLLNELLLRGRLTGKIELDATDRFYLDRAELSLRPKVAEQPAIDAPWCFFDLSEIQLFRDKKDAFLAWLEKGVLACTHAWQAETHRKSLHLLKDGGVNLAGLDEGIARLLQVESLLSK